MISDKQRRETARELRNQLKHMRMNAERCNEELDLVECGNRAYRNIAHSVEKHGNMHSGYHVRIVEQLAELIDSPTCNNVSEFGHDTASGFDFVCSHCGSRLIGDGMCCSPLIDDKFSHYGIEFCPNCGAEVIE